MTCKDCFHYQVCDSFGFVLDPLHGGVTCCDFKTKADVVEVVRCKDCQSYSDFDTTKCKRLEFHFCDKFGIITKESDFCSYGEKKEGANKREM